MIPILIESPFVLYSYPFVFGMAWALGWWLSLDNIEKYHLSARMFNILFWAIFASAWAGAKIFYLIGHPVYSVSSIIGLKAFWFGGGLVFYGGLIGGVSCFLLLHYCFHLFPLKYAHLLLAPLVFAHALGRVGCFLAGCCYGSTTTLPWAVHLHGALRHPVQLYESFSLLLLGLFLQKNLHRGLRFCFLSYLGLYSAIRFTLEFLRGDLVRGIHGMFSTSQWISLFFLLGALLFLALSKFFFRKVEL